MRATDISHERTRRVASHLSNVPSQSFAVIYERPLETILTSASIAQGFSRKASFSARHKESATRGPLDPDRYNTRRAGA
jgi:hypothetical protein